MVVVAIKCVPIASARTVCHAPYGAEGPVSVRATHHALLCTHGAARLPPSPHDPPIRPRVVGIELHLRRIGLGQGGALSGVVVLHALETRELGVVIELSNRAGS